MNLTPYPKPEMRRFKVCKHVFDHRERWWEVFGDLVSWNHDWHALRGGGAIPASDGTAGALDAVPPLAARVDAHHERWVEAASRACDQAIAAGRVLPADGERTRCYVGDDGVTVYVARGHFLRTCFRPARAVGARRTAAQAADRAFGRAKSRANRSAVRRSLRRPSLLSENTPPGDQEGSA